MAILTKSELNDSIGDEFVMLKVRNIEKVAIIGSLLVTWPSHFCP